jgi:tetratricopeptide (TPR) repeat protein
MGKDRALGALGAAAWALTLSAGCAHLPAFVPAADPLDAREHLRLGAAYESQGLKAEAAEQYAAAARREPGLAEAWIAAGNLAYARADWSAAERSFLRALNAAPGHPGAGNNLAMVYLAQGKKLKEAEALARAAAEVDGPYKSYALDTLAQAREALKRE